MNNPNKAEMEQFMAAMDAEAKKEQVAPATEEAITSTTEHTDPQPIEPFIRYLGWVPGENQFQIMFFGKGARFKVVSTKDDLEAADEFIRASNGKHQMYVNVNPIIAGTSTMSKQGRPTGKPSDDNITGIRTVYIDIDSDHPKDTPASPTEIKALDAVIDEVVLNLGELGVTDPYVSFTGNGYRVLVPVDNANPDATLGFCHRLKDMFGEKVIDSTFDASRVTGVPGTLNIKANQIPNDGRCNRARDHFDGRERIETDGSVFDPFIGYMPASKGVVKAPVQHIESESDMFTLDAVRKMSKPVDELLNGVFTGDRSAAEMGLSNYLVYYGFTRENVCSILVGTSRIGKAAEKVSAGHTDYVDNTVDRAFRDTTDRYIETKPARAKRVTVDIDGIEAGDAHIGCEMIAQKMMIDTPWFTDDAGIIWFWDAELNYYKESSIEKIISFAGLNVAGVNNALSNPTWHNAFGNTVSKYGDGNSGTIKDVPEDWINFNNIAYDIKQQMRMIPTPAHFWRNPVPHDLPESQQDISEATDRVSEWMEGTNKEAGLIDALLYPLYMGYRVTSFNLLVGHGSNGKGKFMKLLKRLVGTKSTAAFELSKLDTSRFEAYQLRGKRVGMAADAGNRPLVDTGILKEQTSGDTMSYEAKGKQSIDEVATAKIFISANEPPEIPDRSEGMARRLKIFEFTNEFPEGTCPIDAMNESTMEGLCYLAVTKVIPAILERGNYSGFERGDCWDVLDRWSNPLKNYMDTIELVPPGYKEQSDFKLSECMAVDDLMYDFYRWQGNAAPKDMTGRKERQRVHVTLRNLGFTISRAKIDKQVVYVLAGIDANRL